MPIRNVCRLALGTLSSIFILFSNPANSEPTNSGQMSFGDFILKGDVNLDGVVDTKDAEPAKQAWSDPQKRNGKAFWCDGDINRDGKLNSTDIGLLSIHLGKTVPTSIKFTPGDVTLDGNLDELDQKAILERGKYNTGLRANWCEGDVDRDGFVDDKDLNILRGKLYLPAPVDLKIQSPTSGTYFLTWATPPVSDASSIIRYEVLIGAFSNDTGTITAWVKKAASSRGNASFLQIGLTPKTKYEFRVAGVTSQGTGEYAALTFSSPSQRSTPPVNLVATVSAKSVKLNWKVPVSPGGEPITDYKIQTSQDEGKTWLDINKAESSETTAIIDGLLDFKTYLFRVSAVTSLGQSDYSSVVVALIPESCLDKPNGYVESRPGFKKFYVPFGKICEPAESTRTCNNGAFSPWSAPSQCSVLERSANQLAQIDLRQVARDYGKLVSQYLQDEFNRYRPSNFTPQDLDIFKSYDSTNKKVIWNNNYFANFNFSGFSWEWPGFQAGTLITAQHLANAAHYPLEVGFNVGFYNLEGSLIWRKVIAVKNPGNDISIATLDSPLPEDIFVYPVLKPYDSVESIKLDLENAPVLALNSNLWSRSENETRKAHWNKIVVYGPETLKSSYQTNLPSFVGLTLLRGDSGKPNFILVEGILVLVQTNTMGDGTGPNYGTARAQSEINKIIAH